MMTEMMFSSFETIAGRSWMLRIRLTNYTVSPPASFERPMRQGLIPRFD